MSSTIWKVLSNLDPIIAEDNLEKAAFSLDPENRDNKKQDEKNAKHYQQSGYSKDDQASVEKFSHEKEAYAADDYKEVPSFASDKETKKINRENLNTVEKDALHNDTIDKAQLIKDAQAAGIKHDDIKKTVDTIDNQASGKEKVKTTAVSGIAGPVVEDQYGRAYEAHYGTDNQSKQQAVRSDEEKLFDDEVSDQHFEPSAASAAGVSAKGVKDGVNKQYAQANKTLGLDQTTKQAKATKAEAQAVQKFEKDNQLSHNQADGYLAKTELAHRKDPKHVNPSASEVSKNFDHYHQIDIKNHQDTKKDAQLSKAFHQEAAKQTQNHTGRNVSQTLNKYQSNNKQLEQQKQSQAQPKSATHKPELERAD